ncbi:MAG: DNA polymerase III subunit gamma/tau, partial [Pirellulaceae bacterium]|nr:DNA polymerase III subunit gamma/tau [Pirellulaceae bacterium]
MVYTVLARRYRSTSFGQVVGQEPIVQTLRNAIAHGKVHHALLFTGTRGVGKTSMARIFARALNAPGTVSDCPIPPDADKFPPLPVQERMAEAIMRGDDLNVIEIDGASNRKVEDARHLIEGTGLAPTGQARYKIYIIDEVHMLSRDAFNTLLKTMEEPPAHVKFILCTTEPHKMPATILSRCQRFDLRNISAPLIADHLRYVIKQEKVEADDQVLGQIARLANGSMRDALSLLDRLIAAASDDQTRVTHPMLEKLLGLPPRPLIEQLVQALAEGDVKRALVHTAGLLDQGLAQDQVIVALIEHLRQLMLLSACGPDSELVELSAEIRTDAMKQAQHFDTSGLVYMIALCENLRRFSGNSSNPRALLDATVVRLALAEKMADVTALLSGTETKMIKKKEPSDYRTTDTDRLENIA